MSDLRYAFSSGLVGEVRDRFTAYHHPRSLEERCLKLSQIDGVEGVELLYPHDFASLDEVQEALARSGLKCAGVNLNLKAESKFHGGSFTSRDPGVRKEAAEYGIAAVEMASALGVNLITVCPLADGTDYPFEADYRLQWERLLEWLEVVSSQRADVRIALEYKPNEPRCHVILPNVGVCLHACHESGRENVGVTFDVGHAIYAGEVPAQSISFLAGSNKLFHVHVNDNYRNWDWDLLPGLVNYWDWIECMLYLERAAFDGWFVCDVFPTRLGPEQCVAASYRAITHAQRLLDRLDRKVLWELIDRGDVASTASYIQGVIESDPRAARTEAAE